MSIYREFHYRPRSLAQVSYSKKEGSTELDAAIRLTRIVSRLLNPLLYKYRLGMDFSKTANMRVDGSEVTLFVKTPSQKSRLSQLLPRLENELHSQGFSHRVAIRVRPTMSEIKLRENLALGSARTASQQAASITRQTASTIDDSQLQEELKLLADALER